MRAAVVVTALFAPLIGMGLSTSGCDCASEVTLPPPTAECLQNSDCPPLSTSEGGFCRDGRCQVGLPVEGEGEDVAEGEGEDVAGEGEGEGEGVEGDGEGEVEAGFVIAPTSLAVPAAPVGGSASADAQIVNTGAAPLTLSAVTSSNAAFVVVTPAVGATIAADGSATLTVRFSPTVAGPASATITVRAGAASRTLSVTSTGIADIEDGALIFSAGPDDDGLGLSACECKAPVSPANVDIAYVVRTPPGPTCQKPGNIACGVGDDCAPCNLGAQGSARWRSGRTEQPRQGDAPWIVDEEIVHAGAGDDGDFVLTASIPADGDCLATVASVSSSTNHTCCAFVDCEGGAFACYPYEAPVSCSTDCQGFVTFAMSQDCLARGPVLVRARVAIDGVERNFCATLAAGASVDVAVVNRTAGAFTITGLGNVDEVDPGEPCP